MGSLDFLLSKSCFFPALLLSPGFRHCSKFQSLSQKSGGIFFSRTLALPTVLPSLLSMCVTLTSFGLLKPCEIFCVASHQIYESGKHSSFSQETQFSPEDSSVCDRRINSTPAQGRWQRLRGWRTGPRVPNPALAEHLGSTRADVLPSTFRTRSWPYHS